MNCHECQSLLNAYTDGELDLVKTVEIERHMQECEACAQLRRGLAMLSTSVAGASLYYRAPTLLAERIRAQLPAAAAVASPARQRTSNRSWLSAAALFAIAGTLAFGVLHSLHTEPQPQLAQEVVASHARSLMAEHLYDVESTDQHTVKPWLDQRLDFGADVHNFENNGFKLLGGRLDYLAARPVAALVYGHDKHFINLFTWPANDAAAHEPTFESRQGYALAHWSKSGMNYWAISDTSEETLHKFAKLMEEAK